MIIASFPAPGRTETPAYSRSSKGKNSLNLASQDGPNSDCYVDGKRYPRTSEGITAALATCSPGTTHLVGGSYTNLKSPIDIRCGQTLFFEGNPVLTFALPAGVPAFVYNSSQCGTYENAVSGSAVINMQHTGGTVFKLCVGGVLGGVFGPADGAINVTNQTGNTIDFGPCSIAYSVANFKIQNITSQSVPGDLIYLLTNNYSGPQSSAPYIEAVTFSNIGALDVAGRVIHINANASGPETNVNGVLFEHIFATNSTRANRPPAPIYIESSFLTANSISFQVRDSVIGFPFATGAITIVDSDGKFSTNRSLLSIVLEGVDTQGGTLPTIPFSSPITSYAPATSDLQYRGATNAISLRPLYSPAFASNTPNAAKQGALRLASPDIFCWRNDGNTSDVCLSKNPADQFVMPGPLLQPDLIAPSIGGGPPIHSAFHAAGLALHDAFSAIGAQSCQQRSLTVSGASDGGVASVSPAADLGSLNLYWSAFVSQPSTVALRLCNPSSVPITPNPVKWNVLIVQ